MKETGHLAKSAHDDAAMTFAEISAQMDISPEDVRHIYKRAITKLRADPFAIETLKELAAYRRALRARSLECRELYVA